MTTAVLPNPGLIRRLLEAYYSDTLDSDQAASSHWQYYSRLFRVSTDAQGNPLSLEGIGFGALQWGRLGRVLDLACMGAHLTHLPRRRACLHYYRLAARLCRRMGLDPTFDVFRQAATLALLLAYLPEAARHNPISVLMIGDGYGVLSALIKQVLPQAQLVLVDLGKTLLFQAYDCQKTHPACHHALAGQVDFENADFIYCPADQLPLLNGLTFDLAVNIASMQEMTPAVVAEYFTFMRRHFRPDGLFYCCNRERKQLPGGEVLEFFKYPWRPADQHLVDGLCPWHQYYFSNRLAARVPRLFGVRLPLVNYYDGPTFHRLTALQLE